MKEVALYHQNLSRYFSDQARRRNKEYLVDKRYKLYSQEQSACHAKEARRWLFKLLNVEPEE